MSVYSPLLLPPPQLRGRELREILPPHDPRAFARFSQWLFRPVGPCGHTPLFRRRAERACFARAAGFFVAGEVRNGLIGGCSAGGRRACGARPATDSGV